MSRPSFSIPVPSYFSALPASSYYPPSIQGSYSGYSGHQGQVQVQQPQSARGCYECGELGHMKSHCPRFMSVVSAPIARPPAQTTRGRGRATRGIP